MRFIKTDLRVWERKLIDYVRNIRNRQRSVVLLLDFTDGVLVIKNITNVSRKINVDQGGLDKQSKVC